jgi:hypothetical protein
MALARECTLAHAGAFGICTATQFDKIIYCIHRWIFPRFDEIELLSGRCNTSVGLHTRIQEMAIFRMNRDKVLALTGWARASCIARTSLLALHIFGTEVRIEATINFRALHTIARVSGLAPASVVARAREGALATSGMAPTIASRAVIDRVTSGSVTLIPEVALAVVVSRFCGRASCIVSTIAMVCVAAVDREARCGCCALVSTIALGANAFRLARG